MPRIPSRPAARPLALGSALLLLLAPAAVPALVTAAGDLALAANIKDPVFAVLVAYARNERFGVVTREAVGEMLRARHLSSRLPWQNAREFARAPGTAGESAALTLRFEGPVDVPIPFRILWDAPGRIRSSETCRFREWRIAALPFEVVQGKVRSRAELDEVRLYALEQGSLLVDIDRWLDALLGSALDDTWVGCLAVGRLRGREYGFAVGRNREGQPRIGAFDLTSNSVVFPMSSELRAANRAIRLEYERRLGPGAPKASR